MKIYDILNMKVYDICNVEDLRNHLYCVYTQLFYTKVYDISSVRVLLVLSMSTRANVDIGELGISQRFFQDVGFMSNTYRHMTLFFQDGERSRKVNRDITHFFILSLTL